MSKQCFVIAPIGDPESETRRRSDQVLKHVIAPAVGECGYKAIRADQISEPGLITSQVIQHVVEDPLVIADLTDRNPNVFYELALRHAIRKPLVQLIKKGEQIPFDVAGMRTIVLDHRDLDSVEEAKREVVRQIKNLETSTTQIESPIAVAISLQSLRQSDNPEQRSLADLVSSMAELRAGLSAIETRLSDPSSLLPPSYVRDVIDQGSEPRNKEEQMMREEMDYMLRGVLRSLSTLKGSDLEKKHPELVDLSKYIDRLEYLADRSSRLRRR